LEKEAIDNIKEDQYEEYDRIIDERSVPEKLQDRLKMQILQIQENYKKGLGI